MTDDSSIYKKLKISIKGILFNTFFSGVTITLFFLIIIFLNSLDVSNWNLKILWSGIASIILSIVSCGLFFSCVIDELKEIKKYMELENDR